MKATVKTDRRQKTFEVITSNPNDIIKEAVRIGFITKYDYVNIIKCGRRVYEWKGTALDAFNSH